MLEATPEEFDQGLGLIETRLLDLAQALNGPVDDNMVCRVMLLLGMRARTLFRGFAVLSQGGDLVAAMPLLRPMVEVNLTLRFIRVNPELHSEIWTADGELQTLKLLREATRDRELVAKHGELDLTAGWFTEREAYVADVRQRALAAGVTGVGGAASSSVMPSMQTIATAHGDLATREAYTLAYRTLNQDTHAGARSFNSGAFYNAGGARVGFVEVVEPEKELRRHRALSATTFASTLTLVDGPLGLGVIGEANALKEALLTTVVQESQREDREG